MTKIYSVEVYHHDKDAWTFVGYFVSLDDAKRIADIMFEKDPRCRYSVFQNERCVYSV